MALRFIFNEPAALWKDWLILSDIHLGAAKSPGWKAASEVIRGMMQAERKKKLLILGDLKAGYTGTEAGAGQLIRDIGSEFDLHITKGNHDGNIEKYGAYCTVYGPEGGVFDGLGALHGHAWPSPELLKCKTIIMGHSHPKIVFGKEFKQAHKVWIVGGLDSKGLKEHYGEDVKVRKGIELVSMPSFCASTGASVSRSETTVGAAGVLQHKTMRNSPVRISGADAPRIGPLMREDIFIRKSARIYLLNGIQIQ